MRSLRRNLMLGIGLSAIIMFVGAGVTVYVWARHSLMLEFDAATQAKARQVASLVELNKGEIHIEELSDAHLPEFERPIRPEYYQVWSVDGATLTKSKSMKGAELIRPELHGGAVTTTWVILPDGERGRQVCARYPVTIDSDEPGERSREKTLYSVVAVARGMHELEERLARLGGILLTVSGVATAAMLMLTALVIRRSLSPVDHLAHRITRISARNLSGRLSVETAPRELSPIVVGLNGLLDRLESVFERETSFTADAAHELRTPLAGLESALEVCARKMREPQAYATVVIECLDVVRGMHRMIDNLLLLARWDADQIPAALAPSNLDEVLEEAWSRFSKAADQRGLKLSWIVAADLTVNTDRDKLIHVLSNLFDNAIRYADEGGQIRVTAHPEEARAVLQISNSGSRVEARDAALVFERFWRGDPARTEIGRHCGLGLSVCRKMIDVIQGSIRAKSEVGGEFVVEISLPIGRASPEFHHASLMT